jgi:hypothetical protein
VTTDEANWNGLSWVMTELSAQEVITRLPRETTTRCMRDSVATGQLERESNWIGKCDEPLKIELRREASTEYTTTPCVALSLRPFRKGGQSPRIICREGCCGQSPLW